jgi:uncharacterized membrane protein YeaQ/YmgE (transglycosylase-associated protein family)
MEIALAIVFGIVAGSVAKRVMPGPKAGGMAVAVLVGIAGASFGGLLGTLVDGGVSTTFDPRTLLMGVTGALILVFSYRCFAMRAAY